MQTTVLQPIVIFLTPLFRLPSNDSSSFYVLVANAEAQISAREALEAGISDDDGEDINFKRASNGEGSRKRRVIFDLSDEDEYEDAVNLASPDIPKGQSSLAQKQSTKILVSEKEIENKPKVKEEMVTDKESNQPLREDPSVISKGANAGTSSLEKVQSCIPESDLNKEDKAKLAVPNSPKRRKVLKTRIDERGREGTHMFRSSVSNHTFYII
jgi:DNA polymerase delta subunit 3